jgi:hypothetical protein
LVSNLLPSLQRLNPRLSNEALQPAIEEITGSLNSLSLVNQEIFQLLKSGIKVRYRDENNSEIIKFSKSLTGITLSNPLTFDMIKESLKWANATRMPLILFAAIIKFLRFQLLLLM